MTKKEKKHSSNTQQSWACAEGCDVSSRICEHLEKELPSMRDGKLPRVDTALFTQDVFKVYRPTFDLREFKDTLSSYGLTKLWDIDLMVDRFFYKMSFRQIAKNHNYISESSVRRRLQQLLDEIEKQLNRRKK